MKIELPTDPLQRFDLLWPAGKSFDLVGLGQNTVDHICVLPKFPRFDTKTEILRYEKLPGGQVATALAFASRLGLKGKYVGKVGSDADGEFSAESLRDAHVDVSPLVSEKGTRTHYSFILVDQSSGERTILWRRDPGLNFRTGELKREEICSGRILLLDGSDPEAALQAAIWANDAGIPVVADLDAVAPNAGKLIALVDFLIVSSNFPPEFTGIADPVESLLALRRHCRGFIAATQGARGAIAALGDRCCRFPAFKVRAVDTTGAGDLFHGGFVYGLLQNWPLERIMAFANAAAALNCTHIGARSSLPPLEAILFLIEDSAPDS